MKLRIILIGKTGKDFLSKGEDEYLKRLKRYIKVERLEISDVRNAKSKSADQLKQEEGLMMLAKIENSEFVVILDEKGRDYTSEDLAKWMQNKMNHVNSNLTFVIGGPYGFSKEMYERANEKMSLSKMTFSHQMIRMILFEQLYRSFTIIKNEPYHHQ
ncbi:MAG: 23S rRNA (pseudouridine1915-N3)-methyltransferase [Arenicella sp.]|jgi:23S rRNA (pseudouridine1915-N3)-methyltransferase